MMLSPVRHAREQQKPEPPVYTPRRSFADLIARVRTLRPCTLRVERK